MDGAVMKWIAGIKSRRLPLHQQLIELKVLFRKFPSLKMELVLRELRMDRCAKTKGPVTVKA